MKDENNMTASEWCDYQHAKWIERLNRRREWYKKAPKCISTYAKKFLYKAGIDPTPEGIRRAVNDGRLTISGDLRPDGYGIATHNELLRFSGLSEVKPRKWKYDPYTGKPMRS
jgi:hypothetical protein